MPTGLRLQGMRLAYMRMLGHLAADPDPAARARVAAASAALGEDLAVDLKAELGLGDSLADADAAWAIGCAAFGLGYTRETAPGVVTYDHTGCALWRFFKDQGQCHCATVCLPMVERVTAGLAPSVAMTIDRSPSLEHGCRKSLRTAPPPPNAPPAYNRGV